MQMPTDPIAAVTHPDPYSYYASLPPFDRSDPLGLWVAASAEAVTAVLTHPQARVRPPAEPVPRAVFGTPAERIFRGLARTTDGETHERARSASSAIVEAFDARRAEATAERLASRLASSVDVMTLAFTLPAQVIGSLLGVADALLPALAERVGALVRCIFPGGTPEQIEQGTHAAAWLLEKVGSIPAIGLLAQSYDATAGLIASTLRDPQHDVERVLRFDSPVQNTRRYFAADAEILGRRVRAGDAVLAVLAAANRDPDANGQLFTFGLGPHACIGRTLATTIARCAVEQLLAAGFQPARLDATPRYRPSANCRIPDLVDGA